MDASAGQMHAADTERSGVPLRAAVLRLATSLLVGTVIALVPASITIDASSATMSDCMSLSPTYGAGIIRYDWNEAHAVTPGNLGAKLLTKMAEVAGLSEGQLIATTAGVIAASTGMNLASSDGIEMGATAAHNLGALIDAADYPAWDTLDSETQAAWGTKYDYDAAKYCELLTGLGYGDLVTEFYSSGGGNFDPSEDEAERLQQLGTIGARWADGLANNFQSLSSLVTDKSALNAYFGFEPVIYYDASEDDDWPSWMPSRVMLAYTNRADFIYTPGNVVRTMLATSEPVYMFASEYSSGNDLNVIAISKSAFQFNNWTSSTYRYATYRGDSYLNGNDFYIATYTGFDVTDFQQINVPINNFVWQPSGDEPIKALSKILYGLQEQNEPSPDILDYPGTEEIPEDTQIYYPADGKSGTDGQPGEPGGINPDTIWPEFVTPPPEPEKPRPDNPYNPQNPDPDTGEPTTGTDTPQWREETEENVMPLTKIRFDKLFPFSLLYDVETLGNKVADATVKQVSGGDYLTVKIPLKFGAWYNDSGGEEMELNLTWVHDLLTLTRPWVLVLFIVILVMSVVDFWRGILFG